MKIEPPKFDGRGLPYFGSFQNGTRFECEDPLEEVWQHVSLLGHKDFLETMIRANIDRRAETIEYVWVRLRQTVEFRRTLAEATILTGGLPLYYSLLNLTRAFIGAKDGNLSSTAHGLRFQKHEDVLRASAALTPGTFTDYLTGRGIKWERGQSISLDEALAQVVELFADYSFALDRPSCVLPVEVKAWTSGQVELIPRGMHLDLDSFKNVWSGDYPRLADAFTFDPGIGGLKTIESGVEESHDKVGPFCKQYLEPDLKFRASPYWYLIKNPGDLPEYPRMAYYIIAAHILSSVVRYEPELLLDTRVQDSKTGWLLNRFLKAAERFPPQLFLCDFYGQDLYFSSV